MEIDDVVKLFQAAFHIAGLVGIVVAIRNLSVNRRIHLFQVYKQVFEWMEQKEIREARHVIYEQDCDDCWFSSSKTGTDAREGAGVSSQNPVDAANRVMREFDKLGLLTREGRIPVDLIARFYAYPILACWRILQPYVDHLRSTKDRNLGHMWEFENLAVNIVEKGVRSNAGVWRGVLRHDSLESLLNYRTKTFDSQFDPPTSLWYLRGYDRLESIDALAQTELSHIP
jgi:hypothetical protein